MVRIVIAALLATNAAAVVITAPKMTSFEMGCYMEADPAGESGGAKGRSYRGLVTSTVSGRTCQKWTSDHPHAEAAAISATADKDTDGLMAWGNGVGNHNYCRNPDSSMDTPWCFTQDPNAANKKEACSIDKCPAKARDFSDEASTLATKIGSQDCQCAAQLYGSTVTTKDTAVKFLQQGQRTGVDKNG